MTENDYIAEYVKERCPELLNTVDYSMWKLGKAASEFVQTIADSIKAIDWSKVPIDDLVKECEKQEDEDKE